MFGIDVRIHVTIRCAKASSSQNRNSGFGSIREPVRIAVRPCRVVMFACMTQSGQTCEIMARCERKFNLLCGSMAVFQVSMEKMNLRFIGRNKSVTGLTKWRHTELSEYGENSVDAIEPCDRIRPCKGAEDEYCRVTGSSTGHR